MMTMLLSQVFAESALVAAIDPDSETPPREANGGPYAHLRACSPQQAWNDNRFSGVTTLCFREEDGMPHAL